MMENRLLAENRSAGTAVHALVRHAALAVIAGALLTACDDTNAFEGGGGPGGTPDGPELVFIDPDTNATFPLGDNIIVRVNVSDGDGVEKVEFVGRTIRGDVDLGTDTSAILYNAPPPFTANPETAPTDTTIARLLQPNPAEMRGSERVWFVVTATDTRGAVTVDSVPILVGGPRVEIVSPPDTGTYGLNQSLPIQIEVVDSTSEVVALEMTHLVNGVTDTIFLLNYSPGRAEVDTTVTVQLSTIGNNLYYVRARNGAGITGVDSVRATVTQTIAADVTSPSVRVLRTDRTRVELTDSVQVVVVARDNAGGSGVRRFGITVAATNVTSPTTTVTQMVLRDVVLPNPTAAEVRDTFYYRLDFNVDPLRMPDTLSVQVYGFAVDESGNCGAAVSDVFQNLACLPVTVTSGAGSFIAQNAVAPPVNVTTVTGRTLTLQSGGIVADAVVDTARGKLYMSNITTNRIEVLDLGSLGFDPQVEVGSQPWGVALNRAEDSLIVANSGGTNVSFVSLVGAPVEDNANRLFTPNVVLFELVRRVDQAGNERYTGSFYDFSDRPQFVAQDSMGRLVYSTRPTTANAVAELGTARFAELLPGWAAPETWLIFADDAVKSSENAVAVANIDSLFIVPSDAGDLVLLYDHQLGFPTNILVSGPLRIFDACNDLAGQGSDIFCAAGTWLLEAVGLSDTTFISASGDRGYVAIGEGATDPTGRILLWNTANRWISNEVEVVDLVQNAAERVFGLGLNQNGSLGVARGQFGAYYFTPDLRLQGEFPLQPGGAGAAMHPAHDTHATSTDSTISFVGTHRASVKVLDTFHFFEKGEVFIRDNVVGPMRASLPLPADNVGLVPTDCHYTTMRLYAISQGPDASGNPVRGVTVIQVRRRDIVPRTVCP